MGQSVVLVLDTTKADVRSVWDAHGFKPTTDEERAKRNLFHVPQCRCKFCQQLTGDADMTSKQRVEAVTAAQCEALRREHADAVACQEHGMQKQHSGPTLTRPFSAADFRHNEVDV